MTDIIQHLKSHARILHRKISDGDQNALNQFNKHHGLVIANGHNAIKRQDCLNWAARKIGFSSWGQAIQVLEGNSNISDYGDTLYPKRCGAHSNTWHANYKDANRAHAGSRGYLLPYRKHFFVADECFITTLGLDPKDPDWDVMDRDWLKMPQSAERKRLYGKLIHNTFDFSL